MPFFSLLFFTRRFYSQHCAVNDFKLNTVCNTSLAFLIHVFITHKISPYKNVQNPTAALFKLVCLYLRKLHEMS